MCRFCAFVAGVVVCAIGAILVASSCAGGIDETLLARANVAFIGLAMTVWTFPEHTDGPRRITDARQLFAVDASDTDTLS